MATFNGATFLSDQLESFCRQTRHPGELVVCDDHSTDATVSILQTFRRRAPFPVTIYINESRLGFSGNFDKVLSLCRGDVVLLSDQDDVWLPEKVQELVRRFEVDSKVQLLIHDVEYCDEKNTPIGQTRLSRMEGLFDPMEWHLNGMATAVRTDFLKLCLPVPDVPRVSHDYWLHACASAIGRKGIVPVVLGLYRRHADNLTGSRDVSNLCWLDAGFATTPLYLRLQRLNMFWSSITHRVSHSEGSATEICRWLREKQCILVERGYVSKLDMDREIGYCAERTDHFAAREKILATRRGSRRLRAVLANLRGGTYQSFRGWRSAFKDLLIR